MLLERALKYRKMRILELIEGLDPGGAQRFVVDLCNELAKSNDVALGTLIERDNSEFYSNELSSNIMQLKERIKVGIFYRIRQIFTTIRYIHKFKPEIVHLHDRAFIPGIIPSLIFRKIRFYYTVHNIANMDAGVGVGSKLRKIFLKERIRPIAISQICADSFKEYYGYPPFSVIENGCRPLNNFIEINRVKNEVDKYKLTTKTKVFLNIARFFPQKNHELLIESFNELIQEGLDAVLLIIGEYSDSSRREMLESLVVEKRRIIFLGLKHNVQDYLHVVDYFCLSSSWEGFPITILEAGLSGCFIVATPVGGVPDIINNEIIGILSSDLTKESYKEALSKAYNFKPNKHTIKDYFESKYLMDVCSKRYLDTFSE